MAKGNIPDIEYLKLLEKASNGILNEQDVWNQVAETKEAYNRYFSKVNKDLKMSEEEIYRGFVEFKIAYNELMIQKILTLIEDLNAMMKTKIV
jgi:hypothetical protein